MNLWGFTPALLTALSDGFPAFLETTIAANPAKGEYFLPTVVSNELNAGHATAQVLQSTDKWYGVTYREDRPVVVEALARMTEEGLYPKPLF